MSFQVILITTISWLPGFLLVPQSKFIHILKTEKLMLTKVGWCRGEICTPIYQVQIYSSLLQKTQTQIWITDKIKLCCFKKIHCQKSLKKIWKLMVSNDCLKKQKRRSCFNLNFRKKIEFMAKVLIRQRKSFYLFKF